MSDPQGDDVQGDLKAAMEGGRPICLEQEEVERKASEPMQPCSN